MPKSKEMMDRNPKPMYEALLVLPSYFVQCIIASSFCSRPWVAFAQVIYVYTSCILIPYYCTLQNVIPHIPHRHYYDIEKLSLRYNSRHHLTCVIWISGNLSSTIILTSYLIRWMRETQYWRCFFPKPSYVYLSHFYMNAMPLCRFVDKETSITA